MTTRQIHPIERRSYEILRSLVDTSVRPPHTRSVIERVVHASADLDYAAEIVADEDALARAAELLRDGAPVVTDVAMVAAGITARRTICRVGDPAAARLAGELGITRSAAGIRLAAEEAGPGAVYVIGCAPTALFELIALAATAPSRIEPGSTGPSGPGPESAEPSEPRPSSAGSGSTGSDDAGSDDAGPGAPEPGGTGSGGAESADAGPGGTWPSGTGPGGTRPGGPARGGVAFDVAPALVIGMPVGFVGAVEAKAALRNSGLPAVSNTSAKGGSAVAAAALNALLYTRPDA